ESPEDADRNARRDFGDATTVREATSDTWNGDWAFQTLQDFRHALRSLARAPGFAFIAVLTLALGIGANTAIFSVVNGVLLRPVGITDPEHLFAIRVKYDKLNLKSIVISPPEFQEIQKSRQVLSSAAAENEDSANYLAADGPDRLSLAKVTWQWFDAFGAQPLMGRLFRAEEDQP